jgi:hypothetical protein
MFLNYRFSLLDISKGVFIPGLDWNQTSEIEKVRCCYVVLYHFEFGVTWWIANIVYGFVSGSFFREKWWRAWHLYLFSVTRPRRWVFNRSMRTSRLTSNSRFAFLGSSRRPPVASNRLISLVQFLFENAIMSRNSSRSLLDTLIWDQASAFSPVYVSVTNKFVAASFKSARECESAKINNSIAFAAVRNLSTMTDSAQILRCTQS